MDLFKCYQQQGKEKSFDDDASDLESPSSTTIVVCRKEKVWRKQMS